MKIGLLHPGAMGQSIGLALLENGHEVYWTSSGRSPETAKRAEHFKDAVGLDTLCETVDGLVSICPPEHALSVAEEVANLKFKGTFVDANAVSPTTAQSVRSLIGANYVDGGVIGPPAHNAGTTRLYLSGDGAKDVAHWFTNGPLDARVLEGSPFSASTLKMCFAAWTKGSAALLLNVRALAEATGVADDLLAEWEISQPGLADRAELSALVTAPKAWRFVAEMEEIASTFLEAGLTSAFHDGAADVYTRLAAFKDASDVQAVDVFCELIENE